jgi:hypothetical protein
MTTQPRPCYRHRRRTVWMVGCDECKQYHLAAAISRRDEQLGAARRSTSVAA